MARMQDVARSRRISAPPMDSPTARATRSDSDRWSSEGGPVSFRLGSVRFGSRGGWASGRPAVSAYIDFLGPSALSVPRIPVPYFDDCSNFVRVCDVMDVT